MFVKNKNKGNGLKETEGNGEKSGVLINFLAAIVPFFLKGFEFRNDHAKHLQDNRGIDVRI